MKDNGRKNSIPVLAALLLFGVFAVCILAVLLGGADAYRRITLRDSDSYDSRTCAQFIASKFHGAPSPDSVTLSRFGEGDAVEIHETIDGEEYVTRIYCHDGWLTELFTADEAGFSPEDGEQILPAKMLTVSEDDGLFFVTVTDGNGNDIRRIISLRGREGDGI